MYGLKLDIQDTATPALRKLSRGLGSSLFHIIGRTGRNVVKEHLEGLDRLRHRPHVAHHFYAAAARATNYRVMPGGAEVVINHVGIAQRYFGGEVRAVHGKLRLLHIPVDRESEGRTPREFTGLTWIVNKRKRKGVVKKGDKVLFALTESVDQDPDPSVLPDDDTLNTAINKQVASYVKRQFERGA